MKPALVLLSLLAAAPALAEDRALVIGIDDYTGLATPVVLGHAVADARAFAAFLTERAGFDEMQVSVLTDPTADAIMNAVIDELIGRTGPGDRIVMYFAGLGTTLPGPDGSALPALVATDGAQALGIMPADLFAELFALAGDREMTLVLDAGFAADPAPTGDAVARNLPGFAGSADLAAFGADILWAANRAGGYAWESANGGVATAYLLEGMAGLADADGDGIVAAAELASHLTARSASWCSTVPACAAGGLAPVYIGPEGAAFIPADLLPQPVVQETEAAPLTYDELLAFMGELFGPTNAAGLTVGLSAAQPMTIGQAVSFSVTSGQEGGMILLDINPEGRVSVLFPSALAPTEGERISAGQTITIPSGQSANGLPLQVNVAGPAGRGILLALFSPLGPDALRAVLPPGLDEPGRAGDLMFALSQELLRRDADPGTALDWSASYLAYEIAP